MTTVPDIPVVQLPALDADDVVDVGTQTAPGSIWAVEVPHARRLTPVTLAVLGVLAGIAAMALGTAAVVSVGSATRPSTGGDVSTKPPTAAVTAVERGVLALLAKSSTARIAFRGARGLVLAVGSGGRAAILIRGLAPRAYNAWIVPPRRPAIRAARFTGTERAVFLAKRLGPRASVVISTGRPAGGTPARNAVVALRG